MAATSPKARSTAASAVSSPSSPTASSVSTASSAHSLSPKAKRPRKHRAMVCAQQLEVALFRWLEKPLTRRVQLTAALIVGTGLLLGFSFNANAHIPQPFNRISSVIGWVYFMCWSISFYPQVLLNFQRQSVEGLSFDYLVLNALGFGCYAIFNCCFYFSDSIQQQYMKRNQGHKNAVEANDVFFALHALVLIFVTLFQCHFYLPSPAASVNGSPLIYAAFDSVQRQLGRATKVYVGGTVGVAVVFGLAVLLTGNDYTHSMINTLNWLYLLSYVKLMTTMIKCLPQVVLNFRRKSTVGWTIWNILLDISGGLLSMGQQCLDAYATNDWHAMTGNPVKFSLGFFSIAIDIVFILQHYVLYADNNKVLEQQEREQVEGERLLEPLNSV